MVYARENVKVSFAGGKQTGFFLQKIYVFGVFSSKGKIIGKTREERSMLRKPLVLL